MRLTVLLLMMLIGFASYSQDRRGQGKPGMKPSLKGEIYGQVVDSTSNAPVEYVTVSLLSAETGGVLTGMITSAKGKFALENVSAGRYKVRFDFVGFRSKTIGPIVIDKNNPVYQVKTVILNSSLELEEVVIAGGKPEVTYEIDKKVINVADQDTEAGQSAIEVLETIPSVSIDIDGNMSLRGNSSFTLLINGQPSSMEVSDALVSIPASTIENIEIITNASAKYEAEGVSGIVNIILKKKKLEGTSLLANLSAGNYDNYNGDIAVNVTNKKLSFNVGGNFRFRNRPRDIFTQRTSVDPDSPSQITGNGTDNRNGFNNSVNAEITYRPNTGHSFTIGTRVGNREYNSGNDIRFLETDMVNVLRDYQNDEKAIRNFNTFDANFTYRYNIKRNLKHYLEFRGVLRTRDGKEESITQFIDGGFLTGAQRYTETGPTNMSRLNADYSIALGSDAAFEMGSQIQFGQSGDIGKNYTLDIDTEEYILNPEFSSDVDYTRDIMAVYSLYRGKSKKLGYQVGFRAEQTVRNINSDNFEDFTKINRWDYFPSAHLSYQLPKENQVMLSYSRRINRPRSWYFEPFLTWLSAYQLRSGNPNLQPEYIDALELNWSKTLKKRNTLSVETYFRKVENAINRLNQVYVGNILITRPYNIGESISIGIEPAVNLSPKKWWKMNLGFNFYNYSITGELEDQSFDRTSFNWSARMSNTFKFGSEWKFQFSPQYNSATVTPQGIAKAFYAANASLSKGFNNSKYTVGIQARDVFSTTLRQSESTFGNVFVVETQEPRTPFVSINFSVKLNNYKKKMGSGQMDDAF